MRHESKRRKRLLLAPPETKINVMDIGIVPNQNLRSIGQLFKDSFSILKTNFLKFFAITFPLLITLTLVQSVDDIGDGIIIFMLASIF
ncbi:hypothetical protein HRbin34_00574 [bacterium HR34]|nr:hypothetical protein HRbin34_00574 [bacterium HR34]